METLIGFAVLFGLILIFRAFGAWMFRIDEVIKLEKEIIKELKRINEIKTNQ